MAKQTFWAKFRKKLKTNGLLVALGFISLIAFTLNAWTIFTGREITVGFSYPSLILGLGLMFESRIRNVLNQTRKRVTEITVFKIITFLVGLLIFIGGVMTLPFIPIELTGNVGGVIGFANLIAIVVIVYEIFCVD